MSDMYLILRHRLAEVKQWVTLGTDVMQAARQAKGWSYETAARKIPVSSKTYERYEKRGQVPVEMVDKVAAALGLSIERPNFNRVVILDAPGRREALVSRLDQIDRLVLEVRDMVEDDPQRPDEPQEETP